MIGLVRLIIRRAREERLPQAAGALTFTTILSIVPLLAVSFALMERMPLLRRLEEALQEHLLKSLLPADISRTVLKHLGQFAANVDHLSGVGVLAVVGSALALLLTVENALNRIWLVKKNRPILKRLGIYLVMLVAGPPMLGASLWATSYLAGISLGMIGKLPPEAAFVLQLGPALLGAIGLSALFYYVPNTPVRRRDAIVGGLLASIAFELGKRGMALYLLNVPTYKTMYGAFAAFPVFLMWVYFSWLVTLGAALIAANLPRSAAQPARRPARA